MKLHLPLSLLACVLLSFVASPSAMAGATDITYVEDGVEKTGLKYTGNGLTSIDISTLDANGYTKLVFQMSEPSSSAKNYFASGSKAYDGTVEIVGGTDANGDTTGLILNEGYSNTIAVFTGVVTGNGILKKTGTGGGMNILFTGDVTGYTGNIHLGADVTFHLSFGGLRGSDNNYQGTTLTSALSGSDKGVSGTGTITFASTNNDLTYRYNKGTGTVTDEAGVTTVNYDTAYVLNEIATDSGASSSLYVAGTADMVFSNSVSISTLNIVDDALASSSGGGAYVTLTSGSIGAFSGVAKGLIKKGTGNLAIYALGNNTLDVQAGTVSTNSSSTVTNGTLNINGGGFTSLYLGTGANLVFQQANSVSGSTLTLNSGSVATLGVEGALNGGSLAFNGGTLKYGEGVTTDVSGIVSATSGNSMKVDINGNDVTWSEGALSGASLVVSDGTTTSTTTDGVTTVTNGTGVLTLSHATDGDAAGIASLTIESGTVKVANARAFTMSSAAIDTHVKIAASVILKGGTLLLSDSVTSKEMGAWGSTSSRWALAFSDTVTFNTTEGTASVGSYGTSTAAAKTGLGLTGSTAVKVEATSLYTATISADIVSWGADSREESRTFEVNNGAAEVDLMVAGQIGESGTDNNEGKSVTLIKTGEGTMEIASTAYNHTPGLTIQEGTLIASSANSLGKSRTLVNTVTVGTDATSKSAKLQLNADNTAVILQGSSKGEITSSEGAVLTVGDGGSTARSSSFAGSITGNVGLSLAANTTFAFSGSNTSEGDTVIAKSATLTVGDVLGITSSSDNSGSVTMSGVSYGKLSSDDARYDSVSSYFSEEGNIWHLSGSDETFTLSGAEVTLNGDGSVLLSNISFTGSSLVLGTNSLALENVSFDASSGISTGADTAKAWLYGTNNSIVLSDGDLQSGLMLQGDGDGGQVQSTATTTLTVSRFNGLNVTEGASLTLDVSGILNTEELNEGATIYLAGVSAGSGSVISVTGYDGAVVTRDDGNGIYISTGDAVPEPATATLSLLALAALAARRRRR